MSEYYNDLVPYFDAIAGSRFTYDVGVAAFKAIVPPVATVLEMGCATGTMSILLAKAGYKVTGIDCTPLLLDLARKKGESEPSLSESLTFLPGDIRYFSLEEKSDVILLYESVIVLVRSRVNPTQYTLETYLDTRSDLIHSFSRMRENLKENGTILISVKEERDPAVRPKITGELSYRVQVEESTSNGLKRLHLRHYVERGEITEASCDVRKTLLPFEDLLSLVRDAQLQPEGFDASGYFYVIKG